MEIASLEVLKREIDSTRISVLQDATAELIWADSVSAPEACRVVALSPLGLRLLLRRMEDDRSNLRGTVVEAKVTLRDSQVTLHRGVIVDVSYPAPESVELAIRITHRPAPQMRQLERRREVRWLCSDDFQPTGVAANPARFNDFVLFQVIDISCGGMRLLTSLRNNFLVRGTRLDLILSFPMVSQISIRVSVQNVSFVSRNDKEYLAIGVQLESLRRRELSVIAQYMAQFGDVDSLREFRDGGFPQLVIRRSIECSFVRTEEDYREVLNLRYLAYLADGKVTNSSTINEVSDVYDSRARIIMCKYRGRLIASARLTFNELGDVTEHEEFVPWPSDFPRRDTAVEVTRACTHPEFRRTGVFYALLRHVVVTATQAGRAWVVTSSTEDLVPLYKFVGLSDTGITYNHPELNNLKHVLLLGSIPNALSGQSVGPTAWNQVWKDALPFVSFHMTTIHEPISRIRISIYRSLGILLAPLSWLILRLRS